MSRKNTKKILGTVTIIVILIYFVKRNFKSINIVQNVGETKYIEVSQKRSFYNVEYLLESLPCTKNHKLAMIITSYVGHVELRSAHRRAFSNDYLTNVGIKRVFLLAKMSNEMETTQNAIENEHLRFGDIIQGDFAESYRNLTYKHIMGLKWASVQCYNAHMIMKLDDDIVFNMHAILDYVNKTEIRDRGNFLTGYVLRGMKPIRLKANKWYVTKEEYSKSFYPPFLSGWMYFTTPTTANILTNAATNTQFFWIDDVYVTGILASKNKIQLNDLKFKSVYLEYYELMDCCLNDMVQKNIMCEYSAGPNGNDNNMIVKFNNAIDRCISNKCIERSVDRSLNKTCVSIKKSFPINSGNAVVSVLKL